MNASGKERIAKRISAVIRKTLLRKKEEPIFLKWAINGNQEENKRKGKSDHGPGIKETEV
jgi:hypothetical protein